MPRRFLGRPGEIITMPRWVAWLRTVWGAFVSLAAVFVLILWFQAATRDEEADRNLRVQACASYYAATYDAHAGRFLAAVADAASQTDPDLGVLRAEGAAAAEMAGRRIGLAAYASEAPNDFVCPPLPDRLEVEGIDP